MRYPQLRQKFNTYLQLLPSVQDHYGFVQSDECDSLIFTGLTGSVAGAHIKDITAAYDSYKDQWHRRPLEWPCYMGGYSSSTISRDQLLGLAWYCWRNKRLDIAEKIVRRALRCVGKMGEGNLNPIMMSPGLFATYCWICYKLGGSNYWWARWFPADMGSKKLQGYQAHLQVIHRLLRSELTGKVTDKDKEIYTHHAKRQILNPLFQYLAGNVDKAVELLLHKVWWPEGRLPTKADRAEPWLIQRDFAAHDWEPAKNRLDKIHCGGDFLFIADLILNRSK